MKPISYDAFDKLPPHSIEAEMCCLASMMLDKDFAAEVAGTHRAADFYLVDHQIIFDAIARRARAGQPVDAVILFDDLRTTGQLEGIGGSPYIAEILGTVPSAAHGPEYAAKVKAKALLRGIIKASDDAIRRAYAGQEDAAAILSDTSRALLDLAADGRRDRIRSFGDIIDELVERLRNPGKAKRLIPTGIAEFDRMFGGVPVGLMTLVAARPSMGKSAMVKDVARRMAENGHGVGIISVEETNEVIAEKAAASASGFDNRLIHQGALGEFDREDVIASVSEWRDLPIHVVDDASRLSDIESIMTSMRVRLGCDVIIVDHLHRIDGEVERHSNRTNEVGKISTALANAAKRLDVALIACAQLNRGTEHTGEKPKMSDLRDSGTLEQDARLIMLLYREDYFHKAEPEWVKTNEIEVIVDKNSNGATGVCVLPIDLAAQRINDEGKPSRRTDAEEAARVRELFG